MPFRRISAAGMVAASLVIVAGSAAGVVAQPGRLLPATSVAHPLVGAGDTKLPTATRANILARSGATPDSASPQSGTIEWAPLLAPKRASMVAGTSSLPVLDITPPPSGSAPTSQSQVFVGSAQVSSSGDALAVTPEISFLGSSGQTITTVLGQVADASKGTWSAITPVAAIAPAGVTSAVLRLPASFTGSLTILDSGQLEERDAELTQTTSASAPLDAPLHTSGNQILDAAGRPVTLHGVVLDGLESDSSSPYVTEQAVIDAKAWGANIVRVPLGEQFWISSNCNYSPGYAATVDKVVDWITSLGMVALLDLHYNTVGGSLVSNLLGACLPGEQHNMADEAQAPEFWSQVASRYAANPLVAFDLYNEPHNISDAVWLDGGTTQDVYAPYQTYQAAGMQQLYDVVRSTGATNLVFISGNNWASTPPSTLVDGTDIVYAAHAYTCPVAAPPNCSTSDPYEPSPVLDTWVPMSSSVPVAVTEFGWPSTANGTYNSNVVTFAEKHSWSWIAFAWEDGNGDEWDLATWLADGTAEPNPSGMPILLAQLPWG